MSPFLNDGKENKNAVPSFYYIKPNSRTEEREMEILSFKVKEIMQQSLYESRDIVFLCIGSDRCVADSLGPLVGTMLIESQVPYRVYGTLEEPVHAFNLKAIVKKINKQFKRPLIFSIDACIGDEDKVGYVLFKDGPLAPGKALDKTLPEVGDFHFQGIVNYTDSLPATQFINDTRLFTVMTLAKKIVKVITKVEVEENLSLSYKRNNEEDNLYTEQ